MSAVESRPAEPVRDLAVGGSVVHVVRVLEEAQAAELTRRVLDPPDALRTACWHEGSDLTTIGAPLYRSRDAIGEYHARARATNRLLYETYRDLHERVAHVLEEHCGREVVYAEELAVPGFHLFRYDGAGERGPGGWHLDQVALQAPYFAERPWLVRQIVNFTLPLAVPGGGTGMDIVDSTADGADAGARLHVRYEPGVLLFNEQELRHRIGAATATRAGEVRLTLQGHGVVHRDRLLVFW